MMASTVRPIRVLRHLPCAVQNIQETATALSRQTRSYSSRYLPSPAAPPSTRLLRPAHAASSLSIPRCASLHLSSRRCRRAHNDEEIPEEAPTTDFGRMDMLGQTPAPSTSIDICMSEGFRLDSGASIHDGQGVILAGGEAFAWQPWGPDKRLVNDKGQWEVKEEAFALLDLLWPRPGKMNSAVFSACHASREPWLSCPVCRSIGPGIGPRDTAPESRDEEVPQ